MKTPQLDQLTMTHNRRYANRPDKHAKKEVNNKNPVGNTLDTQFVIRSDGRIGRLYAYGHHYSGDHFNDPVQWRELDDGRNYITHEGKKLYAHHLVWFLVHGEMPKQIKFKDGDKSNFNVENLVAQGIRKPTHQARVRVGDTIKCLGSYPTREAAVEAQDAFKALKAMGIV